MMRKHKVFMPTGTIQTIIAQFWEITWAEGGEGILRFFVSPTPDEKIQIAIFPAGGWQGMQDVSVYEDTKKVVVV